MTPQEILQICKCDAYVKDLAVEAFADFIQTLNTEASNENALITMLDRLRRFETRTIEILISRITPTQTVEEVKIIPTTQFNEIIDGLVSVIGYNLRKHGNLTEDELRTLIERVLIDNNRTVEE